MRLILMYKDNSNETIEGQSIEELSQYIDLLLEKRVNLDRVLLEIQRNRFLELDTEQAIFIFKIRGYSFFLTVYEGDDIKRINEFEDHGDVVGLLYDNIQFAQHTMRTISSLNGAYHAKVSGIKIYLDNNESYNISYFDLYDIFNRR